MKEFDSDGCTGPVIKFWQFLYKADQPPWHQCCLEHDWAYYNGGGNLARATADAELFRCVVADGYPWFAILVWLGVRIFAGKWMPWGKAWGWKNDVE
jgi:hypothetical protein